MKKYILLLLVVVLYGKLSAQSDYLKFRPYHPYSWMIGAGWSFVDNDGRSHEGFFDLKKGYLMHPFPSSILVDKYLKHGFSLELSAAFNQFTGNKMVNEAYPKGYQFSADLATRYSFYQFLQPTKWFDPYLGIGVGVTSLKADDQSKLYMTLNGSVGMNFWMRNFGIRLQGTIKFGLVSNMYYNDSNYLHYSASLLYRIQKSYKKSNSFNKSRYKWARKKPGKYKGSSR